MICNRNCTQGVLKGMKGLQHLGGVFVKGEPLFILVQQVFDCVFCLINAFFLCSSTVVMLHQCLPCCTSILRPYVVTNPDGWLVFDQITQQAKYSFVVLAKILARQWITIEVHFALHLMNVTDWYIQVDYIIDRGPMLSFDMRQIRCKLVDPVLPILLLEFGRFNVRSFGISIGKFHFNNTICHNIHIEIVSREI